MSSNDLSNRLERLLRRFRWAAAERERLEAKGLENLAAQRAIVARAQSEGRTESTPAEDAEFKRLCAQLQGIQREVERFRRVCESGDKEARKLRELIQRGA